MKSNDLWQVRVPPADSTDELLAAINEAITNGEPLNINKRVRVRLFLAMVVHPMGIHHWVNYRTFDPGSGRIIVHPGMFVCAKCPKLRRA